MRLVEAKGGRKLEIGTLSFLISDSFERIPQNKQVISVFVAANATSSPIP